MSVRVEVRQSLLEWARARSGIDDETWGKRFPRYDAWVAGEPPTLKQLEEFARKTHTPVGFFFLDEPPVETVPIPDFRTVTPPPPTVHRGPAISADLLDVVYACQARQEWYRDHQLMEGESPLAFVGSCQLGDEVVPVAARMRELLGWTTEIRAGCRDSEAALTWLREHTELAGVLVMISGIVGSDTHRALDPQEFRGFAISDPHAALVFVNGADSKAAQVFTFVHELAHLWLGQTALSDIGVQSVRSNDVERWCNQVAAEFLVPTAEFEGRLDRDQEVQVQLRSLAEHFRVSTQVILGRMRAVGVFGWDTYLTLLDVERERAQAVAPRASGGGNFYNTKPVQVGKRFARALVASAIEGHTPYPKAFRLLGVKKASTFDRLAASLGVVA